MENNQKTGRSTRRKLQSVFMHHELVNLAVFAHEWILAEEMHFTDAYRRERCMEALYRILGGPTGPGLLQEKMDREMHGILSRLKSDFPALSWKSILVFSYSAAGFTNEFTAALLGLSSAAHASLLKTRLRERIEASDSPYKQEYLALLPRKACRTGEELHYLNDPKYRKLWKL